MKKQLFRITGTAVDISAYMHELRNAYGNGATVADIVRNPARAERLAGVFRDCNEINEHLKTKH